MSHLSGWFIKHIYPASLHEHNIYYPSFPIGTLYKTGHVLCGTVLIAHVPAKRTIYSYDTDTSDSEHARLYQHICTLYCGPDILYMCPSHSPPQDLSKSEKETETGTHRNKPTIINHRPDDSHVSDTKIF